MTCDRQSAVLRRATVSRVCSAGRARFRQELELSMTTVGNCSIVVGPQSDYRDLARLFMQLSICQCRSFASGRTADYIDTFALARLKQRRLQGRLSGSSAKRAFQIDTLLNSHLSRPLTPRPIVSASLCLSFKAITAVSTLFVGMLTCSPTVTAATNVISHAGVPRAVSGILTPQLTA